MSEFNANSDATSDCVTGISDQMSEYRETFDTQNKLDNMGLSEESLVEITADAPSEMQSNVSTSYDSITGVTSSDMSFVETAIPLPSEVTARSCSILDNSITGFTETEMSFAELKTGVRFPTEVTARSSSFLDNSITGFTDSEVSLVEAQNGIHLPSEVTARSSTFSVNSVTGFTDSDMSYAEAQSGIHLPSEVTARSSTFSVNSVTGFTDSDMSYAEAQNGIHLPSEVTARSSSFLDNSITGFTDSEMSYAELKTGVPRAFEVTGRSDTLSCSTAPVNRDSYVDRVDSAFSCNVTDDVTSYSTTVYKVEAEQNKIKDQGIIMKGIHAVEKYKIVNTVPSSKALINISLENIVELTATAGDSDVSSYSTLSSEALIEIPSERANEDLIDDGAKSDITSYSMAPSEVYVSISQHELAQKSASDVFKAFDGDYSIYSEPASEIEVDM